MVVIKKVSKKELKSFLDAGMVTNRLPSKMLENAKKSGWTIGDYHMEKKYKGYPLVIEFCIGDFCVSICSKRGHWLLEKKQSVDNLVSAFMVIAQYEVRIDNGEKWVGEDH